MKESFDTVLILGAGVMGRGIAQACLIAGCNVHLLDQSEPCLSQAREAITEGVAFLSEKNLVDRQLGRIAYGLDLREMDRSLPIVIEAITENLDAKRELLVELEKWFSSQTVFASNTSSFPVSLMASDLAYKERVIGMHFVMPAQIVPLVEVIRGRETNEYTMSMVLSLCKKIRKRPILVNQEITGFVINRLQFALHREGYNLINRGIVTPEDIDSVIKLALAPRFLSTGLHEQKDLSGIDTHLAVCRQIFPDLCNDSSLKKFLVDLLEKGWIGVKSEHRRGFYDWKNVNLKSHIRKRLELQIAALKLVMHDHEGEK